MQIDFDRGIVSIGVGVAPMVPARFVLLRTQQPSAIDKSEAGADNKKRRAGFSGLR